jgi:hypothetical protein
VWLHPAHSVPGRGEGLSRGGMFSFIIGRICTALKQTMNKFDLMMKEKQPKQADMIFLTGKSLRIIFSISAKGLLRCSLNSFTKGKRRVCVSRYKDCKIDDARELIAVLASVDIPTSFEELDRDNVLDRLECLHLVNVDCSNETEFIASHFHELDISRPEKFEQRIAERILSSNKLVANFQHPAKERRDRFQNRRNRISIHFYFT